MATHSNVLAWRIPGMGESEFPSLVTGAMVGWGVGGFQGRILG